jgi:hypothetical protein
MNHFRDVNTNEYSPFILATDKFDPTRKYFEVDFQKTSITNDTDLLKVPTYYAQSRKENLHYEKEIASYILDSLLND